VQNPSGSLYRNVTTVLTNDTLLDVTTSFDSKTISWNDSGDALDVVAASDWILPLLLEAVEPLDNLQTQQRKQT